MLWINFLHLYQPANSDNYIIAEALHKSYLRLVRLLEENPKTKMTFNISGCLLERLVEIGEKDFITRIDKLIKNKQLELVGSASYHAFLPLIPKEESLRQIKENEEILFKYFGNGLKLSGFFLPEMAFTNELADVAKDCGYKWLILDEVSACCKSENFDLSRPFIDKRSGLTVILRSRKFSRAYPPDEIVKILSSNNEAENKQTIISATDGELYGLRHEDPTAELEMIAANEKVVSQNISAFIESFDKKDFQEIELRDSSWESEEVDILKGQAFALWSKKGNKIHKNLWRLTNFVLSLDDKYKNDKSYEWFRWHLKRGMASCTYWWASAHDFSSDFGPYTWNPDTVERGAGDLIRAVRSLENPISKNDKLKAEKYYLKIKNSLWREHWTKHWPQ